ncbi:unnamed protein product [Didymodactylos carnosus]|uniref:Uncharacterized protein n=1 Tax=Didymodactylos carnosus TaxID=1234261 RepID=A0A8S2DYD5_9BILA|nr:unnamed protein product [Didymodactylos carnosus]CAF3777368.1 unnamed protein product [Didymodactylos carnosus]
MYKVVSPERPAYRIVRKVRRVNPNDSPPPRHRSPSVINPRLVQVHVSPNSHRQSSPTSAVPKPRKTIPPHETQRPTYYVPEHAVKQAYNIGSTRLVNKYLIERSDFKQVILWTCLSCCDNQCFDEKCGVGIMALFSIYATFFAIQHASSNG